MIVPDAVFNQNRRRYVEMHFDGVVGRWLLRLAFHWSLVVLTALLLRRLLVLLLLGLIVAVLLAVVVLVVLLLLVARR